MSNSQDSFNSHPTNKKPPRFKKKAFNQGQSQIETQLASLFVRAQSGDSYLRDIEELGIDGVDHINVNRFGKTKLGYLLSTSAKLNFSVLGHRYSSIGNLISYYRLHCSNEEVRTCDGETSQLFGDMQYGNMPQFNNLYALVCLGYWNIFLNNPTLFTALDVNELPLDSYVERRNTRRRHQTTKILIRAIREAHSAVKFNRKPFLNSFILDFTVGVLQDQSSSQGVSMEFLIADMFKPENVRQAYLAEYGDVKDKQEVTEKKQPDNSFDTPATDGHEFSYDSSVAASFPEDVVVSGEAVDGAYVNQNTFTEDQPISLVDDEVEVVTTQPPVEQQEV